MNKKKNVSDNPRVYDHTPGWLRAVLLPIYALLLALIVETISRSSLTGMFRYVAEHPFYFLFNALIILTTLSFSELFKHRRSMLLAVSITWIGLGIANYMVIRQRTQPFTSMDVLMLKDAVTLTTLYYTWPQIILMCAGIFVCAFIIIWLLVKQPKRRRVNYLAASALFLALTVTCFCISMLGLSSGAFPRHFDNLVQAYDKYGFATCFTYTFGEMGVSKPSTYSTESVSNIIQEIDVTPAPRTSAAPSPTPAPGPHVFTEEDDLAHPNIIYVQLESLFDVNTVIGSSYSKDPTPNFNRISRKFPSGELYVPSIGGGTANVEFEMLSGLNLDFFGVGEYPYTTILQETTCETIAYNLLEQGYATTAMHNHTGTFYNRNEVYSRLGFQHFIPLEYMPYITYTDVGWAEDNVLSREIMQTLKATEERDYIMAITVESHGKYDEVYNYKEGDAEILQLPEQINPSRFANYLHLISAADEFVGNLLTQLENFSEPVICIFYGDHLPALDLTADILTTNNLYASRYIIWNNYGGKFEAPNLQAYRVSANLLKQLGMSGGVITKYHQAAELHPDPDSEYFDKLETLEYDLLYGDQNGYESGKNPYEPVDLMLGIRPIEISSVSTLYGRTLVTGKNFTECSAILIDGEKYPTAFISSTQVVAIVPRNTPISKVCVAQIALNGTELGRTAEFTVEKP